MSLSPMKRVLLDGEPFTVIYETRDVRSDGLYYEFAERPGELFRADRTMPADPFHRDVFAARLVQELRSETHVIVGDHDPEPRHA